MPRIEIIAHRAHLRDSRYPENSIPAMKEAFALGMECEVDVRKSADGIWYLYHDDTLPYNSSEIEIAALEWSKIQALQIESRANVKIPKLTDALKEMALRPERRLYLDLKDEDIASACRAVKNVNNVKFTTPHMDLCKEIKRTASYCMTQHWIKSSSPTLAKELDLALKDENVDDILLVLDPTVLLSPDFLEKLLATSQHKKSPIALFIPEESIKTLPKYFSLGFSRFATDFPKQLRKTYNNWKNTSK